MLDDLYISQDPFFQLAIITILAGFLGLIMMILRQPLITAFIVLGLLSGPEALNIITKDNHMIDTLAHLGVALLLFMVGLKLDISLIKKLGLPALVVGVFQMIITTGAAMALALSFGFDLQDSFLIGFAFSFSSTIICVKLLSDKRAIDSLYGKMALGILIVQDIAVIFAMVVLAGLQQSDGQGLSIDSFIQIIVTIAILVGLTGIFIRYLATPLTRKLSQMPELMMIFCFGLAAFMAALCSFLGLSKEFGGLLAGVALASTPYHNIIAARLSPLRDFLLLFFFVSMGAHINLDALGGQIFIALGFSLFIIIGKPLIISLLMMVMRYRKRAALMTGISLSQISEFSLIFTAMLLTLDLVGSDVANIVTLVALITMGLSTYAIIYNEKLEAWIDKITPFVQDRKSELRDDVEQIPPKADVIIFGLGRYGTSIADALKDKDIGILGIDFDPQVIKEFTKKGMSAVQGDASDPSFIDNLPIANTQIIVFAFHHYITGILHADLRRTLSKSLREAGYKGQIITTSHHPDHDQDLYKHGIDIVLQPYEDAAKHGADVIFASLKSSETVQA